MKTEPGVLKKWRLYMRRLWRKIAAVSLAVVMGAGVIAQGGGAAYAADFSGSTYYKTVLGDAVYYGITAGVSVEQMDHMETTLATKKFINTGGRNNDIDLCGESDTRLLIGSLEDSGKLIFGKTLSTKSVTVEAPQEVIDNVEYQEGATTEVIKTSVVSQEEISTRIDGILDHMKDQSNLLKSESATIEAGTLDNNKQEIDLTGYSQDIVYINVKPDDTRFLARMGNSEGIKIKKNENTVVVFNIAAETVNIGQYSVDYGTGEFVKTQQTYGGDDSDHNKEVDKQIAQKVIWNLYNATKVNLSTTAGIFLIPDASSETTVGTSAGWVVSAGKVNNKGGEFHFIYHADSAQKDPVEPTDPKTYTYQFTKYDNVNNKKIEGAKLQLISLDGSDETVVEEWTSSVTEVYSFAVNSGGKYKIKEVSVPDGYKKGSFELCFTVNTDGSVTITSGDGRYEDGEIKFYNDPITVETDETGTLVVTVTDEKTGARVPKAKVRIKRPDGKTNDYETDADGRITVTDTEVGSYGITVTEVPEGYSVTTGKTETAVVTAGKTTTHEVKLTNDKITTEDADTSTEKTTEKNSGESTEKATTTTTEDADKGTDATTTTSTGTGSQSQSPQTGDGAPIAWLFALMFMCAGGAFKLIEYKRSGRND